MPANPEEIHQALQSIRQSLGKQSAARKSARDAALRCLHKYAEEFHALERVEAVVSGIEPNLRCALPVRERIDTGYSPSRADGSPVIIAIDGSQITPERHAEILFGVVNIGAVIMRPNSGEAPEISASTTFLFDQDLYPHGGPLMTEGDIALLRDKDERTALLRLAPRLGERPVALTDGPLELWGAKDVSDPSAFEDALHKYLDDLREMRRMHWTLAGYVDKPGADLVIRLLEILEASDDDLKRLRTYHPMRGAADRWLFGQILSPGQRSAVFAMQSASRVKYGGDLSIHFFYLNVGSPGHPSIARLEIPKWVADSDNLLNSLQAALIEQCSLLASRPYPYVLHRAHETARLSSDEKTQLKQRLLLELRSGGAEVEVPSGKSTAKITSQVKGSY